MIFDIVTMRILVVTFLFFAAVSAKHEQYVGWKSYYVGPSTTAELKLVAALKAQYGLDFISKPAVGREGVVALSPDLQEPVTKALNDAGISYRVHVEDLKKAFDIDDENIERQERVALARNGGKRMPYDNYQEIEVIDNYLEEIAEKYPETVTLVIPAKSFEGRPIKYLKISTTNFEDESKPVIIIDGGIHSREWISPPTVTWAIHKLVENVTEPDLLEKFDFILLPVVNPDGYKFSFTTNRLWRKTRSTDQSSISSMCPGVDGNRNYDFFWNTVGTSSNACADNYGGSRAFSEIETRVVRDILHEYLERTALYLTMHSFGSMILYAWGHNGTLSNNALNLHLVGVGMAEAIDELSLPHFPRYRVGNSLLVLGYGASGASEDYAHAIGVPLAYTYELPGLASGLQGFILHPRYIEQVCKETWEGLVVGIRMAGELYH